MDEAVSAVVLSIHLSVALLAYAMRWQICMTASGDSVGYLSLMSLAFGCLSMLASR